MNYANSNVLLINITKIQGKAWISGAFFTNMSVTNTTIDINVLRASLNNYLIPWNEGNLMICIFQFFIIFANNNI